MNVTNRQIVVGVALFVAFMAAEFALIHALAGLLAMIFGV